jgi:hypothetical protein
MAEEREYLFIGGVAHGQRITTPVGMTKFIVPDTNMPVGGCVRAAARTGREVVLYTRRTISTPVGRMHYFAPEDWSDLRALEQLFGESEE